jgi:hypothetical protein
MANLKQKTIGVDFFLFFTTNAPAVTFGTVDTNMTNLSEDDTL